MRTHLLLAVFAGLATTALAATAPPNFPEVSPQPHTEDACFAAALQLNSETATCDDLIHAAGIDARSLAATHNNRGLILATMGLRDEALSDFETALSLAPNLAEAQINRANILFELARYPAALKAYDAVLAHVSVNQHVALFNRALTHSALGNVEPAGIDFASARQKDREREREREGESATGRAPSGVNSEPVVTQPLR
ncbi:MAG: tetratricopeptide repeat protein [Pseudomonadales bacterium]